MITHFAVEVESVDMLPFNVIACYLDTLSIIRLACTSKEMFEILKESYIEATRLSAVFHELLKRDIEVYRKAAVGRGYVSLHYKSSWFNMIISNYGYIRGSKMLVRINKRDQYIDDNEIPETIRTYMLSFDNRIDALPRNDIMVSWIFTEKPYEYRDVIKQIKCLKYTSLFSEAAPKIIELFLELDGVNV